ncbi:MAG: type I pullulanase [Bacilli bacterium]
MKKISTLMLAMAFIVAACGGTSSASSGNTLLDPLDLPAESEPTIIFHYNRPDGAYDNWNMWIWALGYDGAGYQFDGDTTYGKYLREPLSRWAGSEQIGFIVRKSLPNEDWNAKDTSADRFVNLAEWTPNENGDYHIFLRSMNPSVFVDTTGLVYNGVRSAMFQSSSLILVSTTAAASKIEIYEGDTLKKTVNAAAINNQVDVYINIAAEISPVDFTAPYSAKVYFGEDDPKPRTVPVLVNNLFSSPSFGEQFNYDGELGAIYSQSSTTFKVWAPTSSAMKLRLYNNGTPVAISAQLGSDQFTETNMIRGVKGTWETTVSGDLHGKYYTYVVTNASGTHEVVDPYAKGAGVNGRRGMIVDFSKINPTDWSTVNDENTYVTNTDAIIYELHVRDLSMDSSWNGTAANRGKYAAMHESGTTFTGSGRTVKTGFDHIKELGVNAVHILPMYDHNNNELSNEFNWGYNPLNYNVPEGQYSSNPHDGLVRIREVKEMVKAYDQAGIKIILDVVYNHLGDANGSNFQRLVPGYFFRYNLDGSLSNGSGVGNDTASERYMFSKFIVDSTAFWAEEYKLGGFRFDLMGLHDTATMKAVRDRVSQIDPDTLIYGEAWSMPGTRTYSNVPMANQTNLSTSNMANIGAFSDLMRDAVRGGVFDGASKGWIQTANPNTSNLASLRRAFKGQLNTNTDPKRVVSYVSAHDNHALFDKLLLSGVSEANAPKVNTQASAMMLFSQGIPFFHAGDELMRQKINADGSFNHNSYNAPDSVNSLKWANKATHFDYFTKYQEMIALRKTTQSFRLGSAQEISLQQTDLTELGGLTFTNNTAAYRLTSHESSSDQYDEYVVIHNGNNAGISLNLTGYTVLFVSSGTLNASNNTTIGGNVSVILARNN